MGRLKRTLYRLVEIFDYRTFVVATIFLIILLVGYVMWSAFEAADDATSSADQRGQAATRRIDKLNAQIEDLNRQLRGLTASAARERGELSAKIDALAEQIRRMGGRPIVTTAPRATAGPTPAPQPTRARPSATPSRRPTRPTPTPSPTCTQLPVLGCL